MGRKVLEREAISRAFVSKIQLSNDLLSDNGFNKMTSEGIEIKNPITDALKFLGKRFFYILF